MEDDKTTPMNDDNLDPEMSEQDVQGNLESRPDETGEAGPMDDSYEIIEADHSRLAEGRTVENVMEDSYLRYSMSVIIDRALPDVRDGMKPVHRRILYRS